MPDLDVQIREYIDAVSAPLTVEDVLAAPMGDGQVRSLGPLPLRRGVRRGWLVAAAAAAAVLVVVGGVALLLRVTGSNAPVATTPPTAPSSYTWSRVPHDEAVFGQEGYQSMSAVTVGGPGLVAVGSAVWTSVDGTTWTRVDDEPLNGSMTDVAVGGPGLVAVGLADGATGENAAVWTSSDGVSWSRVPHDEAVFGGEGIQVMWSVTAGGPGLVAVGADEEGDDAAVWTSVDGLTWSRVPHDEAVFGGPGNRMMADVTVGGPGLVAVGGESSARNQVAVVWTSFDGITWSRVPHDDAAFGGSGSIGAEISGVTAGGPGLVAVGGKWDGPLKRRTYLAAVWTSTDGITWARVPDDETVFGGDTAMRSVTAGGPGFVAVGGAAWTSVDGITWSRVPHDDDVFGQLPLPTGTGFDGMWGVTATDSSLWIVGSVWRFDDGVRTEDAEQRAARGEADLDATIWIATAED